MRKKISFRHFWGGFDYKQHSAFNWLVDYFDLKIDNDLPDVIVYSVFNHAPASFDRGDVVRVFFTGEQVRPDLDVYDFAFSFEYMDNERNFRFPLYLWCHDDYLSLMSRPKKNWVKEKSKFCNFLYGNNNEGMDGVKRRNQFFKELQKYKKIDSAGIVMNNTGYHIDPNKKKDWIKDYKFTISFENQRYPGYTTEKLIDPLLTGTLPVYSGNPLVSKDFNVSSFINFDDFSSELEVIDKIIEVDLNDELYNDIMNAPILLNPIPEWATKEYYVKCWEQILNYDKNC